MEDNVELTNSNSFTQPLVSTCRLLTTKLRIVIGPPTCPPVNG